METKSLLFKKKKLLYFDFHYECLVNVVNAPVKIDWPVRMSI